MSNALLDGDQRLPLYQRLSDLLRREIAEGAWRPGDRLPSENVIAEDYGLAPGTARQAISQLVKDGLLERTQGKGTFVRRPAFDQSLFRFFRLASTGGRRNVPESEILSRRKKTLPHAVAAALGVERNSDGILMHRLRRIESEPVLFEIIWLPLEPFQAFMDVPEDEIGPLLYPLYDTVCHKVIARAEEKLSADVANKDLALKLAISVGDPVITIERLAFGYDDTPLEWRRSSGRADLFHYHIEIR